MGIVAKISSVPGMYIDVSDLPGFLGEEVVLKWHSLRSGDTVMCLDYAYFTLTIYELLKYCAYEGGKEYLYHLIYSFMNKAKDQNADKRVEPGLCRETGIQFNRGVGLSINVTGSENVNITLGMSSAEPDYFDFARKSVDLGEAVVSDYSERRGDPAFAFQGSDFVFDVDRGLHLPRGRKIGGIRLKR